MDMMTVCERLGCTLKELPSRMSPEELQLWFARYCIKPWGDEVKLLTQLFAAIIKSPKSEQFLPSECKLDNPLFGTSLADMRKRVLKQSSIFKQM